MRVFMEGSAFSKVQKMQAYLVFFTADSIKQTFVHWFLGLS